MKDFWKMLLAVICGMLIFGFISLFITISALNASVSAAEGAKTVLPRSGVLAIDMSAFKIDEQKNPVSTYESGVVIPSVGILQATRALKIAANDPGVKLIFLKTDGNLSSMASLEEFRKALDNFRQVSGKPVISYIESPTTGGYWLASVADKVYMTEYQGGLITMNGISVRSVFMKDMLDRLGVNMQLIRHGKYKSAGEMFTRSSSSPENTHQYQEMVNSMWATMRADIAASRGISEKALDAAINNLSLCLPEDFLKENLADELFTREELKEKLADLSVVDSYKEVQFMRFSDYVTARVLPNFKSKEKIAIIYANGSIVDGRDINNISGDRFASIIDKVRADSTVKAVVLRVNSPGGSALASEKIKHELDLLGAEKPLVASYGDYAASGGYWISNNCSKIYTDAVCLTGSIGVFGMVPDFSKTTKKVLGINVSSVSSNKHGDMFSLMRPFDSDEYNYMLRSIEGAYERFLDVVSDGRGMSKERVDEIGQGRVWTGADALKINLTDEIGGLTDALNYAALAAGSSLDAMGIAEYPKPLSTWEQIMQMISGTDPESDFVKSISKPQVIARMPYEITIL